ncbi:MAG TPA: efflux RND transporter periplasmic adaptor subunit [Stellaceae bacterium]|nr:efflux RND transporter periplasmic adaptor subunit [Stellaceae bacterium]
MNEGGRPELAPHARAAPAPRLRRKRRRRWPWVLLAVLLIAAGGLAYRWGTSTEVRMHYLTAPVARGTVARTVSASGSVNPVVIVQVGSYVSGVIQELLCDFNTDVKKGQLCAKIDQRPYLTAVAQSLANLNSAKAQLGKDKANLAYAQSAYERNVALLKRGIVSQEAMEASRSAFEQARAQIALDEAVIEQQTAALDAAYVNLDYTNIVSPVDGTVVARSINVGQTVAASFQTPTLFLIATDLTKMQVDLNVSETDIGQVKVRDVVTFRVEAFPDRSFAGEVAQVRQAPQTVQNVVTYDVVVSAGNPESLLKPGMTATARIVTAERAGVLRIPDAALRYSPGGRPAAGSRQSARPRVWVLRDGIPAATEVEIGLDDDTNAEIVGGALAEGDKVVVAEQREETRDPRN